MANSMLQQPIKESYEVLGVSGILKQASMFFRDDKLMASSVLLLLPIMVIVISLHLLSTLARNLSANDGSSRIAMFIIYCVVSLCTMIVFSLIFYSTFLFGVIFTVCHTNDVYMSNSTSLKEVLSRTATTWKKIVISFPSFAFGSGYFVFLLGMLFPLPLVSPITATGWVMHSCVVDMACILFLTSFYVVYILDVSDMVKVSDTASNQTTTHPIGGVKADMHLKLFLIQLTVLFGLLLALPLRYHYHSEILQYAMEFLIVLLISTCLRSFLIFFTVLYTAIRSHRGIKSR